MSASRRSPRRRALRRLACSAAVLLAAGPAGGASLTRYPWVNVVTPTSAVLAWQTDVVVPCKTIYAEIPGAWSEAASDSTGLNHAVTLTGLSPGTLYHYAVVSDTDTLTEGDDAFRAGPAQAQPFRFVAFGDIGRASAPQKEIAARVDSLNADLAVLTGDIIYDNGEPWNYTPQYFDIYNGPGRHTLARTPFYTSLGNHDTYYDGGLTYEREFYLPQAAGTERYYSFDYGDAHFVSLEVTVENVEPDGAMTEWLLSDLAASTKRWKFVFLHVPPYSNLGGHGDDPTIASVLGPIFTAEGVDIVFQGHNHYYTRTFPIAGGAGAVMNALQEPDYVAPGAPIYVVTGGGGRSLYALGASPAYEVFSRSAYHCVVVDVEGSSLLLRAIQGDGSVFDLMTLAKEPPTAVTLVSFDAAPDPDGVRLRWRFPVGERIRGFHVYRSTGGAIPGERLTGALLAGEGPEYEYLDRSAAPGVTYTYRLGAVDESGREDLLGAVQGTRGAPRLAVGRPAPNPFDGETELSFTLDRARRVKAVVLDVAGRVVRVLADRPMEAGARVLRWDGRDGEGRPVAAGVYFLSLEAGGPVWRGRIVRLR